MDAALVLDQLIVGYSRQKSAPFVVAGPINLTMDSGRLNCLIGPNGAGKSTLLRTIAGIQPALSGQVEIMGKNPVKLESAALAKLLSVVLTERIGHGHLKAMDIVAMGRTPYTGWFGSLDKTDKLKISWAIEMTSLQSLTDKNIHDLSDGERQKVMIARALAQDTPVILLDEPTAHLDLPNRIEVIRLLRKLAAETQKAIIMSTHELDLALQAADTIWLMTNEHSIHAGVPEDLVLNDTFGKTFTRKGIDFDKQHGIFRLVEPHEREIAVTGDNPGLFWTKRAMERQGFRTVSEEYHPNPISVTQTNTGWKWSWKQNNEMCTASSIESLLVEFNRKGASV